LKYDKSTDEFFLVPDQALSCSVHDFIADLEEEHIDKTEPEDGYSRLYRLLKKESFDNHIENNKHCIQNSTNNNICSTNSSHCSTNSIQNSANNTQRSTNNTHSSTMNKTFLSNSAQQHQGSLENNYHAQQGRGEAPQAHPNPFHQSNRRHSFVHEDRANQDKLLTRRYSHIHQPIRSHPLGERRHSSVQQPITSHQFGGNMTPTSKIPLKIEHVDNNSECRNVGQQDYFSSRWAGKSSFESAILERKNPFAKKFDFLSSSPTEDM